MTWYVATAHMAAVTLLAFIFAVPPATPGGCAGQLFFGMVTVLGLAGVILKYRYFRSTFHCLCSTVNVSLLALPMLISFVHCFRLVDNTGDSVASLLTLCHFVSLLRTIAGLISHAMEIVLLKPAIWPDATDGTVQVRKHVVEHEGDVQKPLEQAIKGPLAAAAATTTEESGVDFEMQDCLRAIRAHEDDRRARAAARDALLDMPAEEAASRLIFGPPDPLPVKLVATHRQGQAQREHLRALVGEPLQNVMRAKGPLPPGIQHQLALDYQRL